jgi:hypothetical protein
MRCCDRSEVAGGSGPRRFESGAVQQQPVGCMLVVEKKTNSRGRGRGSGNVPMSRRTTSDPDQRAVSMDATDMVSRREIVLRTGR